MTNRPTDKNGFDDREDLDTPAMTRMRGLFSRFRRGEVDADDLVEGVRDAVQEDVDSAKHGNRE